MAGANGLENVTWDSGSCAFVRFGTTKIPLTKFTPPKLDVKVDKPRRVGEGIATRRTPGVSELSDPTIELLLSDYKKFILPRIGKHSGTLIEFVITLSVVHPSVQGSYGALCDHCRIIGLEGPDLEASEKGLIKKATISILDFWEKGDDGVWKTLSIKPLPSADAQAQMQF